MPLAFSISVSAPGLDKVPDRYDDKWLDGQVKNAALWVQSLWIAAVSGGLVLPGMTGPVDDPDYARSLSKPSAVRRTGRLEYSVISDDPSSERIERGQGSFDMKPMLLNGPHAKIGKEGQRYNIIPFRFGTPILKGPQKGQSRPHFPGEETMPPEVYKVVKGGESYPETGEGQRTKIPFLFTEDELGGVNREAVIRGEPAPMMRPYTWKTGLYSGLKGYGASGHRQYYTFRAVSTPRRIVRRWRGANGTYITKIEEKGSSPDSWISPGRAANPVIQSVKEYAEPFVQKILLGAVDTLR